MQNGEVSTIKPRKVAFDAAFLGSKSVNLQVRITQELYEMLEGEAIEREQPLADLVRGLIEFHLIPKAMSKKLSQGLTEAVDADVLQSFRDYTDHLKKSLKEVDKFKRVTLKMSEQAKWLDSFVQKKIDKVIDRMQKEKKGGKFK
jgi:hypothetical protein